MAIEDNDLFANLPSEHASPEALVVPELLSHYTSLEGFLSIIQSHIVRASNILFLNDKEEMQYGIEVAKEVFKEIDKSANRPTPPRQPQQREVPDVYAACFCQNADMLSQWRGYGSAGQSVSIQFDYSRLHQLADSFGFDLENVIYGRRHAIDLLRKRLAVAKADTEILRTIYGDDHTGLDIMRYSRMISLAPRFKNQAFSEEKEWRIIAKQDVTKKVHYRVRDNVIMPYVELSAPNGLPIVSITVGPGKETSLTQKSILKVLSNTEFYKDVSVVTSTIPFRS